MSEATPVPKKFLVTVVSGSLEALQAMPFIVQAETDVAALALAQARHAVINNGAILLCEARLLNTVMTSSLYSISGASISGAAKMLRQAEETYEEESAE